jgi:hypothetical protein
MSRVDLNRLTGLNESGQRNLSYCRVEGVEGVESDGQPLYPEEQQKHRIKTSPPQQQRDNQLVSVQSYRQQGKRTRKYQIEDENNYLLGTGAYEARSCLSCR